ncbi:MAG: class I SAM-dependent methyltransferase [bacterium]|nr:class I SAM-dependent methyltransferase [bacterium]
MSTDDSKSLSQQRFGQYAHSYVTSSTHASGDDLHLLLEMAAPQAHWTVLDIATGGGHTALLIAPHVRRMVAGDLTLPMLNAARDFITPKAANVVYTATDAENMAFADGSFDLVTCRIAPHHFPDCFRFVQECARILKPGGWLLIEDHVQPEDDQAARYIDAFEKLRDPSHHRAFAEYEWRGMYLDAGLSVERVEITSKAGTKLLPWAERQGNSPEVIERLQVMLAQAPQAVAEWIKPRYVGTAEAAFDHNYLLILGRKGA